MLARLGGAALALLSMCASATCGGAKHRESRAAPPVASAVPSATDSAAPEPAPPTDQDRYAFEAYIDASHLLARIGDDGYGVELRTRQISPAGPGFPRAIDPKGKRFAIAQSGSDGTPAVQVWSWSPLTLRRTIARAEEPSFSPDGERVAVLQGDTPHQAMVAVAIATGAAISFPRVEPGAQDVAGALARALRGVSRVRAVPDGLEYVFWTADGKRPLVAVAAGASGVQAVSDDGRWIVAAGERGGNVVVPVGGRPRGLDDPDCATLFGAGFSPDGRSLYVPISSDSWCVLDLATWTVRRAGAAPPPATTTPSGTEDELSMPSVQVLPGDLLLSFDLRPCCASLLDARTGQALFAGSDGIADWGDPAELLPAGRSALVACRDAASREWQVCRLDLSARKIVWAHRLRGDSAWEDPKLVLGPDARTVAAGQLEVLDADDGSSLMVW
jgi:hypothetical protein